jgi:hypothetical protein
MRAHRMMAVALLTGCGGMPATGALSTVSTTVCASGTQWTGGNAESPLMTPGMACIACHTSEREGPSLSIAGTVYAKSSEADRCGGTSSGMTVEITDATGTVRSLTPNAAGNFYLEKVTLQTPYKARLIYTGGSRAMAGAQTDGDCNACHTAAGLNGAPGRISPP